MPPHRLDFHPAAISESRKAFLWYRQRSHTAAESFRVALEFAVEQITLTPDRWPTYFHGTRYRPMRRFPYLVVYRIHPDVVQVVAVAHAKRRPGYWFRRLSS